MPAADISVAGDGDCWACCGIQLVEQYCAVSVALRAKLDRGQYEGDDPETC